jgi:predicted acyl esterase
MRKSVAFACLLSLAAPLSAQPQADVQPGGDIPSKFHPVHVAPIPKGGDIPDSFSAPRSGYQYTRRTAMVPMRDGTKLYVVLIIPRGVTHAPIMLDRTPYSADKLTSRGGGGPLLENALFPSYAELAHAGYIIAAEDVRGKY